MEDGDLRKRGEMNANSNLCPQVQWQLLQDLVLSYDLFVDVKMLIPVINTMSEFRTDKMAPQVCLHLI